MDIYPTYPLFLAALTASSYCKNIPTGIYPSHQTQKWFLPTDWTVTSWHSFPAFQLSSFFSAIRYPLSAIRYPLSAICYFQQSDIRYHSWPYFPITASISHRFASHRIDPALGIPHTTSGSLAEVHFTHLLNSISPNHTAPHRIASGKKRCSGMNIRQEEGLRWTGGGLSTLALPLAPALAIPLTTPPGQSLRREEGIPPADTRSIHTYVR